MQKSLRKTFFEEREEIKELKSDERKRRHTGKNQTEEEKNTAPMPQWKSKRRGAVDDDDDTVLKTTNEILFTSSLNIINIKVN